MILLDHNFIKNWGGNFPAPAFLEDFKVNLEKEFEMKKKILTYEVGEKSTLKISALLHLFQESSEQHLASLGLSYERLKSEGMVFLFICAKIQINRLPKHGEEIRVLTRPCGTVLTQFYRKFEIYSEQEKETVITALQSSVLVDAKTHKIQRPKVFDRFGINVGKLEKEKLPKIILPENMPFVGERPVYYSDLDYNGHLNNAIYADILCDFLPGGMMGKEIEELQIQYLSECKMGEVLKLYAQKNENEVYFYGDNDRTRSFVCKLLLKEQK